MFGAPVEQGGVESGAVYVVEEQLDGTWSEVFRMPAPRDIPSFGYDVVIDGERVVVGSIADHAHLLERVAGVWTHTQVFSPSDGDRGYGHAVAMSGDTVGIGALSRGGGVGGAYVLERDPATGVFQETQDLVPAAATPDAAYGGDVAIDGDMLVMAGDWAEEAVVFERDPTSGPFVEAETLTPADGSVDAAVAIDRDRLVLGDMWSADWDGAAWVYDRDPVTREWIETQRLDDPSGLCAGTPLGLVDPRPWRSGTADPFGLGWCRTTGTPTTSHVVVLVDETTCSATPAVP